MKLKEQKIVLASNNQDKLAEFSKLLAETSFTVLPQSSFAVPEVSETGLTFVENAILKARNACKHAKLPALADDSGLTVDALGDRPGIYSARFAGAKATYAENVAKLLQELREIPKEKRTACFHCVLIYLKYAFDPAPIICHGIWRGSILFESRGSYGFGYDPIFFVPTHNCAAAELLPEIKNQISHRAQAVQQFLNLS